MAEFNSFTFICGYCNHSNRLYDVTETSQLVALHHDTVKRYIKEGRIEPEPYNIVKGRYFTDEMITQMKESPRRREIDGRES